MTVVIYHSPAETEYRFHIKYCEFKIRTYANKIWQTMPLFPLLPEILRWLLADPYNSLKRLSNTLALVYRDPPIRYQFRRYSSPNSWLRLS